MTSWMTASTSSQSQSKTKHNEIDGKKNPIALGIQRAISRSGITKSIAATPFNNNNNDDDDDESHATRFAFIDHSEEAKEITLTMKPHLKHRHTSSSSSSLETSSVIKANRVVNNKSTDANNKNESDTPRGGSATAPALVATRPLLFWESMVSGAISRSIAQTVMHPANTMKTIMQSSLGPNKPSLVSLMKPQMFRRLTRGAGANFILSLPHGAFNFAVLESIRQKMSDLVDSVPVLERNKESIGPGLDFVSSSIATICCSVVSTPQMMITDVSIFHNNIYVHAVVQYFIECYTYNTVRHSLFFSQHNMVDLI